VGLPEKSTSTIRIFRLYKYWARADKKMAKGEAALQALPSGAP
jgi:hypothetical protein